MQWELARVAGNALVEILKFTPRSEKLKTRINSTELQDVNRICCLLTDTIQYYYQRVCWTSTRVKRHVSRYVERARIRVTLHIKTINWIRIILVLLVMVHVCWLCLNLWQVMTSCVTRVLHRLWHRRERGDSLSSTWNKQLHVSTYSFSFVSDLVDSLPCYTQ